jgi:ATP-dependent Clp protease ATP-binding subunit ClpC
MAVDYDKEANEIKIIDKKGESKEPEQEEQK